MRPLYRLGVLCGALLAVASPLRADHPPYPHLRLSNGLVEATVLLPDAERGFYRGSRFDWSGMVWQLSLEGHTFFGPFVTPHEPESPNAGISLAEEFSFGACGMESPLGYAAAQPGETFLKIGVGALHKPQEEQYSFGRAYRLAQAPAWEVASGPDWVRFTQSVRGVAGHGYRYSKRMSLTPGQPELVVERTLRNLGRGELQSNHYCHHFFILDGQPIGPDYEVELAFPVRFERDLQGRAQAEGSVIRLREDLTGRPPIFTELSGFTGAPGENRFVLRNTRTGAYVEYRGDAPLRLFNLYAQAEALCPEPYVDIRLAPREELRWTTVYRFGVAP